jgi:hypothetical protein
MSLAGVRCAGGPAMRGKGIGDDLGVGATATVAAGAADV